MYKDYSKHVDPLSVRDAAVRLTAPLARAGYWNIAQAVALFEHVRAMPYISRPLGLPDYVQTPAETLQRGAGHCESRALLLTSLCRAVGVPSRLVAVQGREGHHLLTEIFVGTYDLSGFYSDLVHSGSPAEVRAKYQDKALSWERDASGNGWLLADPTMSRFVGDVDPLIDSGFASPWPPSWVWTNPPTYFSDGSVSSPQYSDSTMTLILVIPTETSGVEIGHP